MGNDDCDCDKRLLYSPVFQPVLTSVSDPFYKMLVPIQSEELKPNFLVEIEAAQVKESESGIKILTKCVQTERAQFPGGS